MVYIRVTDIEWDEGNTAKCQKHGVSPEEIERILLDTDTGIFPDDKHSNTEKRYIAIGHTDDNRPVFVVYTFRTSKGLILIRPLSARYMHQQEIESYAQKNT